MTLPLCIAGAYSNSNSMFALKMLFFFAIVGILFAMFKLPQGPFVLSFVLANTLEYNFRRAVTYSTTGGYLEFFTRPVSCVLILVAIYFLVSPFVSDKIKARKAAKAASE